MAVDLQQHVEKFREQLFCVICFDQITNAHTLPCMHTFCGDCIRTALRNKPECPSCKETSFQRDARSNPLYNNLGAICNALDSISSSLQAQTEDPSPSPAKRPRTSTQPESAPQALSPTRAAERERILDELAHIDTLLLTCDVGQLSGDILAYVEWFRKAKECVVLVDIPTLPSPTPYATPTVFANNRTVSSSSSSALTASAATSSAHARTPSALSRQATKSVSISISESIGAHSHLLFLPIIIFFLPKCFA
jgi:hypothetical protein